MSALAEKEPSFFEIEGLARGIHAPQFGDGIVQEA